MLALTDAQRQGLKGRSPLAPAYLKGRVRMEELLLVVKLIDVGRRRGGEEVMLDAWDGCSVSGRSSMGKRPPAFHLLSGPLQSLILGTAYSSWVEAV